MSHLKSYCKHYSVMQGVKEISLDLECIPQAIQDWMLEHCMGADDLPDLWCNVDFAYQIDDTGDDRRILSVIAGGLYPIEYELPNTLWHHLEDEVASVIITNEGSYHGD